MRKGFRTNPRCLNFIALSGFLCLYILYIFYGSNRISPIFLKVSQVDVKKSNSANFTLCELKSLSVLPSEQNNDDIRRRNQCRKFCDESFSSVEQEKTESFLKKFAHIPFMYRCAEFWHKHYASLEACLEGFSQEQKALRAFLCSPRGPCDTEVQRVAGTGVGGVGLVMTGPTSMLSGLFATV